jgi:peptidoglycan/xylan/chitin deacetylase (PgdA/CDA1 family)
MPGVALTFDDGPDPRGTPAVLDALSRAGAVATFFVLGERVEREPALLQRVLAAGHDVQVHGYAHLRHSEHSRAAVEEDLRRALNVLPVQPALWRLPYGEPAEFSAEIARGHGLQIVSWTVDSGDWRGESAEAMLARLHGALRDGAIVLMHDGASRARHTAALIGPLVDAVRAKGLEAGRIDLSGREPFRVGEGEGMDSRGGACGGVGSAGQGPGRQ